MKYLLLRLKRFCGFFAGIVFFIAGIFKLLDPVGAGLVMKEYMDFLHIGFLSSIANPSAFVLAFLETIIGAALVTGIWRRMTAIAAILFQSFFTVLTLFLVIFNPEMDCGCFGEVVHLTHFQTFFKNVVLLLLLLTFAFPFRYLGGPKRHKYASFGIVVSSVLIFGLYSWCNIPLVDYTAFKPATALQAGSAFGVDREEIYEAVFVYEKDGERSEFTLGHLPDSNWTFVETRTMLKEGYKDETVSLSFRDAAGNYMDTLAAKGKVMIMSVYDADARPAVWKNAADFMTEASLAGFRPLLLVCALPEQVDAVYRNFPENSEILSNHTYYADAKTLITMNRSNAGVTYFSDGYLVRKWAARSCPDGTELQEIFKGDDTETIIGADTSAGLTFQAFLLYVFAVMLLL